MQKLTVLGSTGSIGCSTLQVVALHPDKYSIFALSGQKNVTLMLKQCQQFKPKYVVMTDPNASQQLQQLIKQQQLTTEVLHSPADLNYIASASEVTTVMAAIVGAAGLQSSLAAASAGKRLLLANKETLVVGGSLLLKSIKQSGAELIPIDSEHSAIFQSLPAQRELWASSIDKLILTASGGAFRDLPLEQFANVSIAQATSHPNFKMGRKISVDSATMANKVLEVIEAKWLFAVSTQQIEVLIHPQQVIHSMVQYKDGSIVAQLGNSDMRIPIAYGLAYPQRIDSGVNKLDFSQLQALTFNKPDKQRYPIFALAEQILTAQDGTSIVFNAANEVAVDAFLTQQIPFTAIAKVVEQALNKISFTTPQDLVQINALDQQVRQTTSQLLTKFNYAN